MLAFSRMILPATCMALLTSTATAQTPSVTIGGISHIQGAYSVRRQPLRAARATMRCATIPRYI